MMKLAELSAHRPAVNGFDRLRILYVSYPLLTVAEDSAGGAEQILWTLDREMSRRGVATAVAASEGSRVTGDFFNTGKPCRDLDDFERRSVEHQKRTVSFIRREAASSRAFDLVHDMSGGFWPHGREIATPVLATLHLPRDFYSPALFANILPNVSFNCVSASQARDFHGLKRLAGFVENGLALDRLGFSERSKREGRSGLLWLGRICPEKAPHLALEIAERAGVSIVVAGQVYPFSYHRQYFEREVAPRLVRMSSATFVDSPSAAVKQRLLRRARALLITSQAKETSSLVAMEAAASGTPVIAFARGALPEIVRHGVTGFLVEDIAGAVHALNRLHEIAPEACVAQARRSFSSERMAEGYLSLYKKVLLKHAENGRF